MAKDRYFETTNGKFHDTKFLGGPYGNGKSNVYKKAPALYNVKYVKDHAEKVSLWHHSATFISYLFIDLPRRLNLSGMSLSNPNPSYSLQLFWTFIRDSQDSI